MRAGCTRHGRPGPSVPPCFRHLAMKKNNVHKAPRRRLSWNDPAVRSLAYQAVLVGIIGFVVWYLVSNTLHNLAVRNLSDRKSVGLGKRWVERVGLGGGGI